MTLPKPIAFTLLLVIFCLFNSNANAQLWRYLNESLANEKAAELAVEREASSVKEVIDTDSFHYKIITYDLQSFEGEKCRVTTVQKPLTKILNISCGTDSLDIYDLMGVDSVHFLTKNLLEIIYSPRGGSDDGYQNTMILYINKDKIGIALEIETDHQFDFPNGWGEYYATVKLTGENRNNYKLLVKTNDRLYSKAKHAKNHNLNDRFVLSYDTKRNIFYSNLKLVDDRFDVYDYSEGKFKAKHFQGKYPLIKLDDREYYYIKGIWYRAGKNIFNGRNSLVADGIR